MRVCVCMWLGAAGLKPAAQGIYLIKAPSLGTQSEGETPMYSWAKCVYMCVCTKLIVYMCV